jgi:hypothetical protein
MELFAFADLTELGRGLLHQTNSTLQSAGEVASHVNQALTQFLAKDHEGKTARRSRRRRGRH